MTLYEMTKEVADLYDLLSSNDEIDEETKEKIFADTVEAMGVDEKLEAYCTVYRQLMADAKMVKDEMERLKAKQKSLERNADRLKDMTKMYMETTNQSKMQVGIFSVKITESKATNILDINKIPEKYLKVKTETSADKTAIKKAILSGETVEGAEVVINKNIKID